MWKLHTHHDTSLGLWSDLWIAHLNVTELPAWAWMSRLPSMSTEGTKTKMKLKLEKHFSAYQNKFFSQFKSAFFITLLGPSQGKFLVTKKVTDQRFPIIPRRLNFKVCNNNLKKVSRDQFTKLVKLRNISKFKLVMTTFDRVFPIC